MKLAIHQPQYMPWLGYFHKMAGADLFVFLDDAQFKKNEWQHRNRIRNPEGWQWLSVPNSYRFPQAINQVKVRNETGWQQKHLKSLEMCYGKSAYYSNYIDIFKNYYEKTRDTMDSVALDSVRLLAGIIGINTSLELSSQYRFEGKSTQRLIEICRHFSADTYLAGAGGRGYMDLSLFEKEGVNVVFQEFRCPRYRQRWCKTEDDFIPDLSAVDLIFNNGPESLNILKKEI